MLFLVLIPAIVVALLAALWLVGERGHLALPSTRAALRDRRATEGPGGGLLQALHGYIYGRWPEAYIGLFRRVAPWMGPRARQAWADHYHGKVLPTELACSIIRLDHSIRRDLDHIIPYPRARTILLQGPPQVTLLECPCRLSKPVHCEPTQVCMLVGGGNFALDHHPTKTRRVTQEEALALLQAEHQRGHVHTAYFKDAVADRFYAICNCCKCCCGGLEAMTRRGIPMVASSGFVAEVDEETCIGCGDCEDACPFGAIHVPDRAEVTWASCMGCGVCEGQCATGAVKLVRDERKGIPLDVCALA